MDKIRQQMFGGQRVLEFAAPQKGSENTTPVGDSEMREDNQAQVISSEPNRHFGMNTDAQTLSFEMIQQSRANGNEEEKEEVQPAYKIGPEFANLAKVIDMTQLPQTLSFAM